MARAGINQQLLKEVFTITPHLAKIPINKMSIDYDKEADVLYISFNRPQNATDSEMLDDGVLLRYKNEELVGMTIFDASKR